VVVVVRLRARRKAQACFHLFTGLLLWVVLLGISPSASQAQDVDWLVNVDNAGFDPIPANGTIEHSVSVLNNGTDAAPATTITFDIPATTIATEVQGFAGCAALPVTGAATVTCDVPALAPDGEVAGTVFVQTTVAGAVEFSASVPTDGDFDPGNNTASVTTTVQSGADLELTVSGPASAAAGSTQTYTLTVENLGPDSASGMTVEFPIPTGLANISPPAGCTLSGSTYSCDVPGTLAVGRLFRLISSARSWPLPVLRSRPLEA